MGIWLYYLLLKLINNVGWQDNICQHHKQCIMMKIRKKFGSFLPTNAHMVYLFILFVAKIDK